MNTDDEVTPTGYDELLWIIQILPDLVHEKRRRDGLSLRDVAELTDLSASTVDRFERRVAGTKMNTLVILLRWVAS